MSRETVKRSALGDAADYGWCSSRSRFFWGFKLHLLAAPDGTPRAVTVASPKRDERDVALELLARTPRHWPVTVIGDKGYAGRQFATDAHEMGATTLRLGQQARDAGIAVSMGSKGDAYDNAVAESFFATIKKELVHRQSWPSRQDLSSAVFEYIEAFYNRTRRHSTLGYLSPEEYERKRKQRSNRPSD